MPYRDKAARREYDRHRYAEHRDAERTRRRERHRRNPELAAYQDARARCTNPEHKDYRHYGGQGIRCELTSAQDIIDDIGPRPPGKDAKGRAVYSLDRIDNTGHYRKGNLRWATRKQQLANRGRKFSPRKMRENGASWAEIAMRSLERLGMVA